MKHLLFFATLLASLVGLCAGCSSDQATIPSAAAPSARAEAPPAAPAEESSFVASGPVVVENQVDVVAQRDGIVTRVLAEAGAMVRKGRLLADLDDRELVAERDAAAAKVKSVGYDEANWEARVKVDEVDLSREEKMMKDDLITREQLDHARYKLIASRNELERERQDKISAQATLRGLDLELEKTQIMAPFDGVVARRYVRAGQKVAKGDRLFWVTAVAPLRVKFTLPEKFIGRVKRGDSLNVSSAETPDQKNPAKVIEVSPVIDPSSGTIEVLAELTGKPEGLRPGMTAKVRFENPR